MPRKRQTRKRQTRKRQTRKRQTRKRQTRKRQGKMEGKVEDLSLPAVFSLPGFRPDPLKVDPRDVKLDPNNSFEQIVPSRPPIVRSREAGMEYTVPIGTEFDMYELPSEFDDSDEPIPEIVEPRPRPRSRSRSTSTMRRPASAIKKTNNGIKCRFCSGYKKAANSACKNPCKETPHKPRQVQCAKCGKKKAHTKSNCCE